MAGSVTSGEDVEAKLQEAITMTPDDPDGAVERVLDVVEAQASVGMLIYFRIAEIDGRYHYDGMRVRGGRRFREYAAAADGAPILGTPTLKPERPPRRAINRFQTHNLRKMGIEDSTLYRQYLEPFDVHSACRMLVYRGSRLAGWLGVHRRVDQPVCNGHLRRAMDRIAGPLRSVICAVDELRGGEVVPEGLSAVLRPTGVVEYLSPQLAPYLSERRREALSDAVRRVDPGDTNACVLLLDCAEVTISRLCGGGESRYLASFSRPLRPQLHPIARLTDAQREIVEYAATGATNVEIAEATGRSPNTVKGHLHAAYEELEVGGRVELAELLTRHRVRRQMKR